MEIEATAAIIGAAGALAGVVLSQLIGIFQERVRRRHDRAERRYDDKRSTYVNFALACSKSEQKTRDFEEQYDMLPGDDGQYQHLTGYESLSGPLEMIEIFAPRRVNDAAEGYVWAINSWAFGSGTEAKAKAARARFLMEMQADLKLKSRLKAWRDLRKERCEERRAAAALASVEPPDPPPGVALRPASTEGQTPDSKSQGD